MKSPCAACGYIHTSTDARAIGRFGPEVKYVAANAGTPPRSTRAEAEADQCCWRIRRELFTPEPRSVSTKTNRVMAAPQAPREQIVFPAAEMETAARAKAWLDFLSHVRLSLEVWGLDRDVRAQCDDVLVWIRQCRKDLDFANSGAER